MKRPGFLPVVNLVAFLITIAVNGLANALPINGNTTASVSDQFPVLFVPAGYVFAIWGLIYLGLLAFAVYQALPSQADNPRLQRMGWWFAVGSLANATWIFFWHYEVFPVTLVLMLTLLISLLVIYTRLSSGRSEASRVERWLVDVPFSVYLGWITVATVANAADVSYSLGWTGAPLTPQLWTVIMLLVAAALAVLMALRHRDVAYVAVIVWAFVGIAVKQSATPLIAWSSAVLAVVAAAAAATTAIKRRTT